MYTLARVRIRSLLFLIFGSRDWRQGDSFSWWNVHCRTERGCVHSQNLPSRHSQVLFEGRCNVEGFSIFKKSPVLKRRLLYPIFVLAVSGRTRILSAIRNRDRCNPDFGWIKLLVVKSTWVGLRRTRLNWSNFRWVELGQVQGDLHSVDLADLGRKGSVVSLRDAFVEIALLSLPNFPFSSLTNLRNPIVF